MFISISNPLFSLSFLFLCIFLHIFTALRIADASAEREFFGETRRYLEDDSATSENNTTLILAAERTHRKDPTDGFKKYTGGWNISSDHYWASVGFSAAPLYVIAGAWFLVFGLTLFIVFLCYCCRQSELFGYSQTAYILSLIFLIFFTIAAIVGCAFLYTGQRKFHRTTRKTLNYVVYQADDTSRNLRNMSGYLDAAKRIRVHSFTLAEEITSKIDNITRKINSSATTLLNEASSNSDRMRTVLEEIFSLTILVAVIILLVILGFLASVLGLKCVVYFLVILGWILVTGTFILCGVFLHLHNVVADTCVAMEEWVQNPTAHTALDDILPCLDNETAHDIVPKTKDVTYQLVALVNTVINNVTNKDVPKQAQAGPHYFNQSGPLMPTLCNPFNSDPARSRRHCADDEASLNNASEVWRKYVCKASSSGICRTPGRMNPDIYNQMTAAANVSYGLYRDGPYLVSLADCSFVREAFTSIRSTYCPGLRRYSEWIYIAAVVVAASVMMSLIFWVIYARERCHRVYNRPLTTELDQENVPVPPIN